MAGVDVEGLFRKFQVSEIRDMEKKVKGDIEQKKEDLRQMVGRRYRDIIETADSIRDMKSMADNIVVSLHDVQLSFDKLEKLQQQLMSAQQRAHLMSQPSFSSEFVLEVQLKLLLELPEMVWECIDSDSWALLPAVWCLILAQSLHDHLCIQVENGTKWRELIDRQMHTIRKLKIALLERCNCTDLNWENGIDCDRLCAILLLQSCTINDLLFKVIESRKSCLGSIFESSDLSSREQICHSVIVLQTTVMLVNDNFVAREQQSKVMQRLITVLNAQWVPDVFSQYMSEQSRAFQCALPEQFRKFRPPLSKELLDVPVDEVKTLMNAYIEESIDVCGTEIGRMLEYFESIDSLRALKQSAQDTLNKNWSSDSWRVGCENVLGAELDVWEALLKEQITQRLKTITQTNVQQIFDTLAQTAADMTQTADFVATKSESSVSELTLKARAVSPHIYSLCSRVHQDLSQLRESLDKLLEGEQNCVLDKLQLLQALSAATLDALQRLCTEMNENHSQSIVSLLNQSQLCVSLCELCPSLHNALSSQPKGQDQNWIKAKNLLSSASTELLRCWSDQVLELCVTHAKLMQTLSNEDCLRNAQEWEAIQISEQSESGTTVISTLHVPVQCSPHLHRLLASLTHKLTNVGAHRFPRAAREHFLNKTLTVILDNVELLSKSDGLRQKQAIQLLFDCRLLASLLACKNHTDLTKRSNVLSDQLESHIDPFDLDVLRNHIKANIAKSCRKLMCLYGVLVLPETAQQLNRSLAPKSLTGSDQPQLLPLHSAVNRFQLLPVAAPTNTQTPFHLSSASSIPSFAQIASDTGAQISKAGGMTSTASFASFYDKISSSWFGN